MNIPWGIIANLLYFNAVIGVMIAGRSWILRSRPSQKLFALLIIAASFYSIIYGLEITSLSISVKTFWIKVENISIVTIPPIWFLFAIRYNQQARWLTKRHAFLLFIIPSITLFLLATKWSFFHYASLTEYSPTGGPLIVQRGPWYEVQIIHTYILLSLGVLSFLWAMLRHPENYRGHSIILLIGLIVPWIFNLFYIYGPKFFPLIYLPVDFTPAAFIITGVIYSIGIFQLGLLDLIPIARDIVFENIPELVMVLDPQNRIIDLNHTGQQWLGITKQKAVGHTAADVLKDFSELLAHSIDAQISNDEIEIPGDPPRHLELVITPLFNPRKQFFGRVVVARDITSRKQADRILQAAHEHINLQSAALEAAANAIVISDRDGRCIWVNPAFTKITGYSMDEMLGERLSKLKSGVQGNDFYRNLWEVILRGEIWNGEIINKHKDGHLYTETRRNQPGVSPIRSWI